MASSETTHTPTPWKFEPVGEGYQVSTKGGWFLEISVGYAFSEMAYPAECKVEFEADIAFIVKAVNSFDDMLVALKAVVDACTSAPPVELVKRLDAAAGLCAAAIAKAEPST